MIQADNFPILGIQDFSINRSDEDILYNNLSGKRLIDHPHKHDFFVINLFKKGNGSHTIDFAEYKLQDHQLHMIFPDQVHQWEIEENTVGYQLMISRKWFENLIPYLRFPVSAYLYHPVMSLSEENFKVLSSEFKALKKLLNSELFFSELVMKRCEIIALLISQSAEVLFHQNEHYSTHPILTRFNELIERHFREERQVAFYAEKLNISANYLNVICRKNAQVSASSLIQNRILLEAKRLLKISDKTVKDIVYDLGFYDQASFSKFFKMHTGMTPTEFKG